MYKFSSCEMRASSPTSLTGVLSFLQIQDFLPLHLQLGIDTIIFIAKRVEEGLSALGVTALHHHCLDI